MPNISVIQPLTNSALADYLKEARKRFPIAEFRKEMKGGTTNPKEIIITIADKDVILEEKRFSYLEDTDSESDFETLAQNHDFTGEDANQIYFRPKANILILLGEELIKSPVMAIYELIKNSYDADAKVVSVDFEQVEDPANATIRIQDDGTGITEEVLENVWFEPGSDFRKPLRPDGTRIIKRSPVFGRIPMGEKGVGRFAVHKLSSRINLITRPFSVEQGKLLDYELHVEIDWRAFSQQKYLQDVGIFWTKETDPENFFFKEASGTYIELQELKESWTRGMARQLKRNTLSMLSPKNDSDKFRIDLNFNNGWLDSLPDVAEILKAAPYKLTALLDSDYNLTFEYRFELKNNPNLGTRVIDASSPEGSNKHQRNIRDEIRPFVQSYYAKRKEVAAPEVDAAVDAFLAEPAPFGTLMLELYSYDLDSESLRDTMSDYTLIKNLLREHAGVKMFKGDLRVYDYGDPGNDWLGLDLKRVQNKDWFSNNQVIGFVYLDPATSGALIEKTNREGFILNTAFERLELSLDFILTDFKAERSADRRLWLAFNHRGTPETFEGSIAGFRQLVNDAEIPDSKTKERLLLEAGRIEARYEQDRNSLLIPAGVGMTASFAIHEIEKLVPRMQTSVSESPLDVVRMRDQVAELDDYVNGILSIMKKGGVKPLSVKETIDQAAKNYNLKMRLRNINLTVDVDPQAEEIKAEKRLLLTMLMNLIDNSIYWLEAVNRKEKGIFISAQRRGTDISLLVVDNGTGFKDKVEDLVKPFFSRKENGIGIGMYLIDTAMMRFGKLNVIYDKQELLARNVPPLFDGAAVELVFNNQ
ncbi:sensor histidine kinase [Hymenobacter properus]|uniref:histidine kinase n=1 Tax=Hymenobacter properus TaxID=2791026 RepID=A0A931BQ84_9BACT|nr:ATP-binding protein [Hymenobacter properus]MBF9144513.1 sensor histidine kinase [Hymenobacter properus]MBR7723331.1 sensor histidine kinase [Microvirga sp. SRT04]